MLYCCYALRLWLPLLPIVSSVSDVFCRFSADVPQTVVCGSLFGGVAACFCVRVCACAYSVLGRLFGLCAVFFPQLCFSFAVVVCGACCRACGAVGCSICAPPLFFEVVRAGGVTFPLQKTVDRSQKM